MQHRPEIDGLRSIAVLPVMFFHAGLEWFSGGYVGVDVFFVISGYLITSIILRDLELGKFSILRFYERRIRRILPALYLVLMCTTIVSWFTMLPDPLENYGQSLFATTVFANNVLLTMTAGYWDLAIELKPLVHTWSLGVEEQYYAVFPVLLFLVWRLGKGATALIFTGIALASLVAAQWGAEHFPTGNFYLVHSRFWELLVGALCAVAGSSRQVPRSDLAAFAGLAMIVYSIFAFSDTTPFPSLYALVPTVGTALIILFCTQDSPLGRILCTWPMVTVGLISYSAYLWHQPAFAFARIVSKTEPAPAMLAATVPAILGLGYLSWRYVETPFRSREQVPNRLLYPLAIGFSAVFLATGLAMHLTHGFPARVFPPSLSGSDEIYIRYNESAFGFKKDAFTSAKPVRLLIIGDSFGRDIVNMVRETLDTSKIEIVYRNDLGECLTEYPADSTPGRLLRQSSVIIINRLSPEGVGCMRRSIGWAEASAKKMFVFGTKQFGYNINWMMRVPPEKRALLANTVLPETRQAERWQESVVPPANYVALMPRLTVRGQVLFTDGEGRLLTADTKHLTRYGAIYLGQRVMSDPRLRAALDP